MHCTTTFPATPIGDLLAKLRATRDPDRQAELLSLGIDLLKPRVALPSVGAALVELLSVVRMSDGRLSATFADGDRRWQVRCTAAQVQTFSAFQRIVASKLGLWIRHDCQDARRARDQVERWQDEVAAAFDAGAKG